MMIRILLLALIVLSTACNGSLSSALVPREDGGRSDMTLANDSGTPSMDSAIVLSDLGIDSSSAPDMSSSTDMSAPTDMGTISVDAGDDASMIVDAGHDAGNDAGHDAGVGVDAGPSSGCGIAHASGKTTITLTVMGETRTFMISVTDAYDPTHPAPLLFGVHGCGDTSMGAWYSLNLVTDGSGVESAFGARAIYVYPQGVATGSCSTGWTFSHLDQDLAFMDAIRAYMAENYCVDASGVMVIGLSYGAEFANRYACRRPSEIIFSSPLAAGDAVPTPCSGDVPMWISWGSADFGISESSYNNIRDTWLTNNGCSLTMSDAVPESPMCRHYRDCDSEPVISCRIEGGLHAVPSPNYGPALFAFYRRLIGELPWP